MSLGRTICSLSEIRNFVLDEAKVRAHSCVPRIRRAEMPIYNDDPVVSTTSVHNAAFDGGVYGQSLEWSPRRNFCGFTGWRGRHK